MFLSATQDIACFIVMGVSGDLDTGFGWFCYPFADVVARRQAGKTGSSTGLHVLAGLAHAGRASSYRVQQPPAQNESC